MIQEAIEKICGEKELGPIIAEEAIKEILEGKATPSQISAFLVSLRMKGESPEEILTFVKILREKALKIKIGREGCIDVCGTGGDGKSTFNVSTISSFVLAGCGIPVAKHGNRAISSMCGSADLMARLGINLSQPPEKIEISINKIGLGFLYAPCFHPAMKHVQPVRREIGIRTVFNILGPFLNPAEVKRQLIGFFDEKAMEKGAEVARLLGGERYLLVHSADGLDEISIFAPTRAILVEKGTKEEMEICPEDYGLGRENGDIRVKSPEDNVRILFSVLANEDSRYRDMVILNAGAGIFVSGKATDIKEGLEMAEESLSSGKAMEILKAFLKFNREG